MPERCPGDHPHLYSFFKHENVFNHVREGDLFGGPFFLYKSNSNSYLVPLTGLFSTPEQQSKTTDREAER
jgi:hypothetical protein